MVGAAFEGEPDMTQQADFQALARRAVELVRQDNWVGLGSGRTAEAFLEELGKQVRKGLRIRAVPTSEAVGRRARELGITVENLPSADLLDMTIDGADEVERNTLNLIKGWGGALVRERIVAAASKRQVILVTEEKLVERLGSRGRLPIEVLPFAAPFCRRQIEALKVRDGIRPEIRGGEQKPFITDNGNWILDCGIGPLEDPPSVADAIRAIPGVVDTGLFLGTADMVLVESDRVIQEMHRPGRR
jgi:ribose 5-phosphate isomerase A